MIGDSWEIYAEVIYMCIELIRQFYDTPRKFRSKDSQGNAKYITYTNENLQQRELPPPVEGMGMIQDPENPDMMIRDPNTIEYRRPEFDIAVKPEKASPFSKAAMNQMGQELFNMGFFNPQRAVEAKIALEMMAFEGKDKILKMVSENGDMYMQIQEMQQMLAQQQKLIAGMNEAIKRLTGRDMMGSAESTIQEEIGNGNSRVPNNEQ
jgi:hypothetical protein